MVFISLFATLQKYIAHFTSRHLTYVLIHATLMCLCFDGELHCVKNLSVFFSLQFVKSKHLLIRINDGFDLKCLMGLLQSFSVTQ